MGLSYIGIICLEILKVNGNNLEPVPPDKIIPFILIFSLLLSQKILDNA